MRDRAQVSSFGTLGFQGNGTSLAGSVPNSNLVANHWLTKLTAYTFMLPYLMLVVSPVAYRATQLAWLGLAVGALFLFWKSLSPRSSTLLSILTLLVITTGVTMVNIGTGTVHSFSTLIKIGTLAVVFLFFDAFRFLGLQFFMRRFAPIAVTLIIVTLLHFLVNPTIFYGRYTFFSLHPNLGGEILFSCVCCIAYLDNKKLFVILSLVALLLVGLMQARSALIALIVFTSLFSTYAGGVIRLTPRSMALIVFFGLIGLGASLVLLWGLSTSVLDILEWFLNSVLLLDDPHRGTGTGISGRDHTWDVAYDFFSNHPFLGVGIDNATVDETALRVHSGPILLLAEYGATSILLFGVLFSGLRRMFRADRVTFSVLCGSLCVFVFQARGLNLNIFPLLMWVICLPWVPTLTERRS